MPFRDKTFEEFVEVEQELLQLNEEEQRFGYYNQLISLYEEMHRKLSALVRENKEEYADNLKYVERKLVSYLIKYGTYLKTIYQKDNMAAEMNLKKALKYDRQNPIAHYRLGFLAYKSNQYFLAINYFKNAGRFHKKICIELPFLKGKVFKINQQKVFKTT